MKTITCLLLAFGLTGCVTILTPADYEAPNNSQTNMCRLRAREHSLMFKKKHRTEFNDYFDGCMQELGYHKVEKQ